MAYMEGLCNIDGGKLHANVFALSFAAVAVIFAFVKHAHYRCCGCAGPVLKEVKVAAGNLRADYARGQGKLILQLRSYCRGGLAHGLSQAEAGEGIVPHAAVRRNLYIAQKLRGIHARCGGYGKCNVVPGIHSQLLK